MSIAVPLRPTTIGWTVHSEATKAGLKLVSWLQYLGGVLTLALLLAYQFGAASARQEAAGDVTAAMVFGQPEVLTLGWIKLGMTFLLIWSAWILTSEVGTTLGASLLATPSRLSLLLSKALLTASVSAALYFCGALVTYGVGAMAGTQPDPMAAVDLAARLAIGVAFLSIVALGIAAATGSFTLSLVIWLLSLGFEEAVAVIAPLRGAAGFLPFTNLWNWSGVTALETSPSPFSPLLSLLWLALLAVATLGLGTWRVAHFVR